MSSPNRSVRARVSTSSAMASKSGSNFHSSKWSTDEIVQFLGLLKRYPVLYQKIGDNFNVKARQEDALEALFNEQASHNLGLPDIATMKYKISGFQKTFAACLNAYKKDMSTKGPSTVPAVKWFTKAGFLDQTGFLRKAIAMNKPMLNRSLPPTTRSSINLRPRRQTQPVTVAPPAPPITRPPESNRVHVKDEPDEHMDDDETEEGEYIPGQLNYHNHNQHQESSSPLPVSRPTVRHSMPAAPVHVAPITQQEHASYHQHPESSIAIDSVFHHADFNSTMTAAPAPRELDYLSAFLDYARIRTQGYTGRQKRQIINVLSTLMNNADEENESPGPDYGYPMYEYSNPAADSLK